MSFIEGREKAVAGTSYKELREVVHKIYDSRYFDASKSKEEKNEEIDGIEMFLKIMIVQYQCVVGTSL